MARFNADPDQAVPGTAISTSALADPMDDCRQATASIGGYLLSCPGELRRMPNGDSMFGEEIGLIGLGRGGFGQRTSWNYLRTARRSNRY